MPGSTTSMGPLRRGLRRGVQQISRDRSWGSTLLLLTGVMVLAQLFIVFMLGVDAVGRLLTAQAGIQLEVLASASEQDIQELYAELRSNPLVERVEYIPQEQAYEQQKASDPDLIAFIEEYKIENPFPNTFAVTLTSLDFYHEFVQQMQDDRWRTVVNPSYLSSATTHEQELRTLVQVTAGLRTLSAVCIVLTFVVLFFVVFEWVSRNAVRRGQELFLEHVLGASAPTVLLPFASEMTFLLLGSVILGTLIVGAFIALLPVFMPAFALEAPFMLMQTHLRPMLWVYLPLFLLIEMIALPLLACAGTILGVRNRMPPSFTLTA